jgi:hypothetical protein
MDAAVRRQRKFFIIKINKVILILKFALIKGVALCLSKYYFYLCGWNAQLIYWEAQRMVLLTDTILFLKIWNSMRAVIGSYFGRED